MDYEMGKVQQQLGEYSKQAPTIISRALTRAIGNVQTNVSRSIAQKYELKQKVIKETFNLKKANKSRLSASLRSTGFKMGLHKYKMKQKKDGVYVSVRKDTGQKLLKHAFVADIHGDKVFQRKGKSRLPIDLKLGPSIPQLMNNRSLRESVMEQGMETYNKRLDHEIKNVFDKAMEKAIKEAKKKVGVE